MATFFGVCKEAKLSPTQRRAFRKLVKGGGWATPWDLKESMATLDSLVRKGLVKCKGYEELGAMFSPRTTIKYKSLYRERAK